MSSKFIRADEVAAELEVSVAYAYKIMKKLNDELDEKGFITVSGQRYLFQLADLSKEFRTTI